VSGGPRAGRSPGFVWLVSILALIVVAVVAARVLGGDRGGVRGPAGFAAAATSASPASRPSATAVPTPSAAAGPRESLLIHAAGDVSLDPGYISTYASNGYGYAWSGLNGLFRSDDLTIVNVECPVTNRGANIDKQFSFHGTPDALPAMRRAGVEVGSLANNHAYDRGPDGLLDSVRNLREAGIAPIGAGRDQDAALRPAMFDLRGWRVAVLGLDEVLDPLDEVARSDKPGTAAGHDFGLMLDAVKGAAADADLVVVMIHWGVELDTDPRPYQVSEAHKLVDAGADMIFGSHSHRVQPLEVYRGKPVFYSLGNFVWPDFSSEGSSTGVAQVRVRPNGDLRARLLPARIVAPGHPELI
jgi:Bacterial capsule synthesis protein PGA_cap